MSCWSLSRCLGLLVYTNVLWLAVDARAPLLTYEFDNLNITVGDNDPSGVTVVRRLAPEGSAEAALFITDVNVRLGLVGELAYNGDFYAYLQHGAEFAVLLNRVGRRTGNEWGYGDAGFDITLDDQAPNGDVHLYRMTLFGNHDTPLGGPLTQALGNGSWQPDARRDDPAAVLAESGVRTALLSQFNGSILGGDWTLFVADLSEGGSVVFDNFAIELELTPIPEAPACLPALLVVVAAAFLHFRRCRRDGGKQP